MSKVVPLHPPDALVMPIGDGGSLRLTRFISSAQVALSLHGPAGGDRGGVILHTDTARLLASWLLREADAADRGARITRHAAALMDRPVPAPAR